MNILLLTTIISITGCLSLGGYALKFNPKDHANRYFAAFCFVTVLWLVFSYLSLAEIVRAIFVVRTTMVLAVAQSASLLLFVLHFSVFSYSRSFFRWYCGFGITAALVSAFPFVFSHMEMINGVLVPVAGPGMPIFAIFAVGSVTAAIVLLTLNVFKVDRINRIRTFYILLGLFITMGLVIISNFFLIVLFHSLALASLGLTSVLFFVGFTTFAMTRYRFLDVKVIFSKSVVYGAALVVLSGVYLCTSIATYVFFERHFSIDVVLPAIFFSALYVFMVQHVGMRIKRWLDGLFFRDEIDLAKLIHEENLELNTTHELESFVLKLAGSIQQVSKAKVQQVFVAQKRYSRLRSFFPQHSQETIHFDDPLFLEIQKNKDAYLYDELQDRNIGKRIRKLMKKHKAEMYVPVWSTDDLLAIILIGQHKNAASFGPKDIAALEEFQKTAAASIPTLLYWQSTVENLREHLKSQ